MRYFVGTANVVQACVQCGVGVLVFTSTVDVAIGYREIVNGDESLPLPDQCLVPDYGHCKREAEKMVENADGRPLADGTRV